MLRKYIWSPVWDEAGDDGDKGGGGGGDKAPNLDHPEVRAAIDKAVSGLKAKNDELLGEVKKAQDAAKAWEGLDPEEVRTKLKTLDRDSDLQMLRDGKLDELVAKKTEDVRAKLDAKLSEVTEALTKEKEARTAAERKLTDRTVSEKLRAVAEEADVLPSAVADVIRRGQEVFSLDADGELEARNGSGELIRIKIGDSERLLTPALFVDQLKETAGHYWANGRGAGSRGSRSGGGASDSERAALGAAGAGDMEAFRKARGRERKAAS